MIKALNELYTSSPALFENDCEGSGFEWIEADDRHNSIFAFLRKSSTGKAMLVVINFTPVFRESYRLGVDKPGYYRERLNTDSEIFGGSNQGNSGGIAAEEIPWQHRKYSLQLKLPPLAAIILELSEQ